MFDMALLIVVAVFICTFSFWMAVIHLKAYIERLREKVARPFR